MFNIGGEAVVADGAVYLRVDVYGWSYYCQYQCKWLSVRLVSVCLRWIVMCPVGCKTTYSVYSITHSSLTHLRCTLCIYGLYWFKVDEFLWNSMLYIGCFSLLLIYLFIIKSLHQVQNILYFVAVVIAGWMMLVTWSWMMLIFRKQWIFSRHIVRLLLVWNTLDLERASAVVQFHALQRLAVGASCRLSTSVITGCVLPTCLERRRPTFSSTTVCSAVCLTVSLFRSRPSYDLTVVPAPLRFTSGNSSSRSRAPAGVVITL